jgi:hypothetical protein
MIYTLLTLLVLSCMLHLFIRARYNALKRYADKVDTERIAMALEIGQLKDSENYINYQLHERR